MPYTDLSGGRDHRKEGGKCSMKLYWQSNSGTITDAFHRIWESQEGEKALVLSLFCKGFDFSSSGRSQLKTMKQMMGKFNKISIILFRIGTCILKKLHCIFWILKQRNFDNISVAKGHIDIEKGW